MTDFEEFQHCLGDTVANLYHPAYWPPECVWSVLGCDPRHGIEAVQAALIQAIDGMEPASSAPLGARSRRLYGVLTCRYLQGLTQDETADRLGITARHVRREQAEAIHALAVRLWEQRQAEAHAVASEPDATGSVAAKPLEGASADWRLQIRQELSSLQRKMPGAVADVGETIQGLLDLARTLTARRGIVLSVGVAEPGLVATMHPSALRQVMLMAISSIAHRTPSGEITLSARPRNRSIEVIIAGGCVGAVESPEVNALYEILHPQGGSVQPGSDGRRAWVVLTLPALDHTVLVVDDNLDMVHVYRRYTMGTRYRIVHAPEGQDLFQTVKVTAPDLIVLDVMLPGADGWELLAHLHEHLETRQIPVVVATVVREEELALALGADGYLAKPIERQQFVQVLDAAFSRAASRATRVQENSAPTY